MAVVLGGFLMAASPVFADGKASGTPEAQIMSPTKMLLDKASEQIQRLLNPPFSFALIGDQPYHPSQEKALDTLLKELDRNHDVEWILHVGDIKGGSELCTDSLIRHRLNQLKRIQKALVLLPGDNEWTDCHRDSNGSFDPQERLAYLRKQVYTKPLTLGKAAFKVRQQTALGFPEHLMWQQGSTLFITLNIPGSNNDLVNPSSRGLRDEEVQRLFNTRQQAVDAWLAEAEQLFKKDDAPTETVIAFQGDPLDGSGTPFSMDRMLVRPDGYEPLMKRLVQFTANTHRPMLIAHGDTHRYRWDQPDLSKYGATPEVNALMYRVEGWGHPFTNQWVKVTITPGKPKPFQAESILVSTENPN
ncbi:metallophosphoesterase [Limnobacter humi]|uniref:Metallophosphoesterase n=1 Tax=Limnobacter humi TaxID=1778671 RepID=A0ABT1WI41_9BURK|nr:metallophosphoesterase [Limnobacter humi]MCQ8897195.1 metallophosphoesterase [Limnobacter humi]